VSGWKVERWGGVRVAGLDAGLPSRLRLSKTCAIWDALFGLRQKGAELRDKLLPLLHLEVARPEVEAKNRRTLLQIKRDLFNGRPIAKLFPGPELSAETTALLSEKQALERSIATTERNLAMTWKAEVRAIHNEMWRCLAQPNLLRGLLLSNTAQAAFALRAVAHQSIPLLNARKLKMLSAIARLATRAALRPTPFSTFASAGLLDWQRKPEIHPTLPADAISTRLSLAIAPLRAYLNQKAGFVVLPRLTGDPENLGALGKRVPEVAALAEAVTCYAAAPPTKRQNILQEIQRTLSTDGSPVYEDILIDPEMGPPPPCPPQEALAMLEPVLHFARSSLTDMPHLMLCQAYILRHGIGGVCEDVGGFLSHLLGLGGFVNGLRRAASPPAWLNSPIRNAAENEAQACIHCPADWFFDLPARASCCDLALFFSLGAKELVLNSVQSGRGKYLSRFLHQGNPQHARALRDLRTSLATEDPLPVALPADLDINFQIHPPLCAYAFDLGQAEVDGVQKLPLSDFTLRFDERARCLELRSRRLDRVVEPIQLGFLRDMNLPDSLLLLRALSPRLRDETLSERVAVHDTLDIMCLASGRMPPPFRPRLTVGRVVLERARWIIRSGDIPRPTPGEENSAHLDRLLTWLMKTGLPRQCTVHPLALGAGRVIPQFLDWASPYGPPVLRYLARGTSEAIDQLVLRENLPLPEETPLRRDGTHYVAEWVLQARYRTGESRHAAH
jgi:hypothetical protein